MRLLVTRPLPDAHDTARRLIAAGHEALVQPLLRIVFAPPPREVAEPAGLLITSRNALRAVQSWPQARRWRDRPLFAVGKTTAREAAAAGFSDVRIGGGDATALADAVSEALSPDAGPLIYPAARERTGELAETLTDEGYTVTVVETYRAESVVDLDPAVRQALVEEALDGVLLYSRRTAEAFLAAVARAGLTQRLSGVTAYALSADIGGALAGVVAEVKWPERPEEALLLVLIGAET